MLQSYQVHPTVLTTIQHRRSMKQKHKIHTNKSTHSEMGPVWQNLIQRTVRTAHLSVLMTVHSMERLVSEMTYVSSGMLNAVHSLTLSLNAGD